MSSVAQNTNKPLTRAEITDLLREVKKDINLSMNCVNIGTIQSFNAAQQTATIQLNLKSIAYVAPDGTRTLQDRPLLLECPVFFPFGGVSYLSMPVAAGDTCIVLFNDREIDNWFVNGGSQAPTSYRTHDSSDAMALVGIKNMQNAVGDYITDGARLSFNSTSRITLQNNLITSIATTWRHNGSMIISNDLTILGNTYGDGSSNWNLYANVKQQPGYSIHAGNGANGTFNYVTVVDGIVISGS